MYQWIVHARSVVFHHSRHSAAKDAVFIETAEETVTANANTAGNRSRQQGDREEHPKQLQNIRLVVVAAPCSSAL